MKGDGKLHFTVRRNEERDYYLDELYKTYGNKPAIVFDLMLRAFAKSQKIKPYVEPAKKKS